MGEGGAVVHIGADSAHDFTGEPDVAPVEDVGGEVQQGRLR